MPQPQLSVVVSTIGRDDVLRRLAGSVDASSLASGIEFVVVDQSDDQRCIRAMAERSWTMAVRTATTGRGVSVGRNAGLALATAPLVLFPDDDAWYPDGTLEAIRDAFAVRPGVAAISGRQLTSDGRPSMLRWQSRPGPITARNFLRTSIMSTMFFRRPWLDRVGPFDEDMGVGTGTWYGAGEESDLLLRVVEAGGQALYLPDLVVHADEPRDTADEAFVRKMLSYGAGQGHLWRKRSLPLDLLAYYCARKVAAAAVRAARGERTLARADLAWVRGNVAGYLDVPPRQLRDRARVA